MKKSCSIVFVFAVVLSLVAAVQTANAVVIFQDDFQSDTATLRTYNDGDDFDPVIGAGDVGGAWNIPGHDATYPFLTQVTNNVTPWDWNSAAGDNNYLTTERPASSYRGTAQVVGLSAALSEDKVVVYSGSMFVPSKATAGMSVSAWDTDLSSDTPDYTQRAFDFYFLPATGYIAYYDGANWIEPNTLAFTKDTWQDFKVTADMAAKTYTIDVEGNTMTANWVGPANAIQSLWLNPDTNGCYFSVDNLVLDVVPEPSVLIGLISMGLLAAISLLRRK